MTYFLVINPFIIALIVYTLVILFIGYLLGSIPVAYLYCKKRGINIFEEGSGNPGSTNVGRVLGKKHGKIVFVLDILKTLLGIFVAHLFLVLFLKLWLWLESYIIKAGQNNIVESSLILECGLKSSSMMFFEEFIQVITEPFTTFVSGLGVILGHNFPFTTKFRGGKGITCTVAVVAYFNVIFAVVLFFIHKIIGKITGYVSLASILTLIIMFLSSLIISIFEIYPFDFGYAYAVLPEIFIMMGLGIARHKDNILRLEHGTENKM